MKIAILSPVAWRTPPRHYGPWEQMASNHCEGLVKRGHDVHLYATGDSITTGSLQSVVDLGYEEDPKMEAKVAECLHISHLMERADEYDIIHNHFDFLPLTYSKLISTPVVTTIHGFSSPVIVSVFKKYQDHCYLVSISNSDRSPNLNYTATVYNGIKMSDFELEQELTKIVPKDYLLFFGRIHPDKGVKEAIAIAKQSKRELIISGIVQDERYFQEEVEPHLNDQIKFIGASGPQSRCKLLSETSALLHPINFDEPFGLSVVEAMACGTPVIAVNRGSMPELIIDGETGFLVEDVEGAVSKVDQLVSLNRGEHRQFIREHVRNNFSAEKMVVDYEKIYQQILS